jgi:hypothetical protein
MGTVLLLPFRSLSSLNTTISLLKPKGGLRAYSHSLGEQAEKTNIILFFFEEGRSIKNSSFNSYKDSSGLGRI